MFGAGKKTYDLFTKDKSTGRDRINPNLSKEIKTALGTSKYERVQQTIYQKRKELKERQYEDSQKEKKKKEMDEIRETIRKKQQQIEGLENEGGSQDEIDKLQSEIRSLETEHQKARNNRRNAPTKTRSRKKISVLDQERERLVEEEKAFEAILGVKNETMEGEMKLLQIDKEELEKAQEKDFEIMNDSNAEPFQRDAAEVRWNLRKEEFGRRTTQQTEERPLLEKIKDIFQKYGVTVTAIFLAAGVTIGAIIGALAKALKVTGKALGNGLKTLGKKVASPLPGLLGAIVSFLFKAGGQAVSFLAEHTWLLILAGVAFLIEILIKKRR